MESKPIRITPRLCRAARALLGWQQADIATHSGVSKSTISQFELRDADGRLTTMNNKALIEAFEKGGIQFIPENGGGLGIRFRDRSDVQ